MSTASGEVSLESAIATVYRGPLEEFVRRRDALAKELRSAGRREDASAVKRFRKPSRMAWALDMAALQANGAIGALDTAAAAMIEAHAGGGDVRGAIAGLRVAARDFARHAARAAEEAGHRFEEAALANAVLDVLGKTEAFSALRCGWLVEVPEAGGLDFLSSIATPELVARPPKAKLHDAAAGPFPSPDGAESDSAAREVARQAGIVLAAARERSEEARQTLRGAESKLRAAEEQLRQAEMEVRALRSECDRARQESEETAALLLEAERAVVEAESRLDRLTAGNH